MRCYGHMAHGTSPLYTSVRSLRDLHSVGPSALGCVNSVETCTSVYNLHIDYRATTSYYVYGIGNGLISRDTPPNTWPQYVDMGYGNRPRGQKNLPKMVEMGRCYRFVSAS